MHHVHGSHDTLLVIFSYIVAVVASYTVLDLAGRVSMATGVRRNLWLSFGAIGMGMGIWSMHFVGMLAFKLEVPVYYDLMVVLLSVLVAIIASYITLRIVSRERPTKRRMFGGGVLLATGIASMHYIGMAAMLIDITYDRFLFVLSIVIALVASIAALGLAFYFRKEGGRHEVWKKLISGLIMGGAIAGMHYVGMFAAEFHVLYTEEPPSGIRLDQEWLAYLISLGTLVTLGLSIGGVMISRRFSIKDSEIERKSQEIHLKNKELKLLNDHLEDLVNQRTAQLEQASDEAIRANLIKSQFLANMSHELRTPLNAIIGYSEMLVEEASEMGVPEFASDVEKIGKSGKHLLALINDILDISKIEAGKMELYLETFELQGVLLDVLTTVQPMMEKNNNRIETSWDNGLMETDVTKLRQILLNLLGNAAKFTENGTIRIEGSHLERAGQPGYTIRVTDSGIGMRAEQVEKLFEPFIQADSSTTRKYGGTGLGLTITKHYCELLGGTISAESELGSGSTFTCWFPLSARLPLPAPSDSNAEAMQRVREEAAISRGNDPVSILLIDDEPINGQIMRSYLPEEQWVLSFAESGEEGLALAHELKPELICLDILMPNMDGWKVLTELKSDPQLRDIPVIIVSMTDDKPLAYSLGASEFMNKPIDRQHLLTVLRTHVGSAAAQTILVVEDDETTSEMMAKLLTKEGYNVLNAANGKVALRSLEDQRPAMILLDLMMPEMDGYQFLSAIKQHEQWRTIPILVVTAKSIAQDEGTRLRGYVQDIIQKGSFDPKRLLAEIEKYAEKIGHRTNEVEGRRHEE